MGEGTMLILRLNVKHSIFAQLMELEVWLSTASSVLMVHSSTRTTSSVIGGSTLTAPLLKIFTLSTMKSLLNVKLLLLMPWENTELLQITLLLLLQLVTTPLVLMKVLVLMKKKVAEAAGWETGETTDEEEEGEETSEVKSKVRIRKPNPETNWIKALTELVTVISRSIIYETEVLSNKTSQNLELLSVDESVYERKSGWELYKWKSKTKKTKKNKSEVTSCYLLLFINCFSVVPPIVKNKPQH